MISFLFLFTVIVVLLFNREMRTDFGNRFSEGFYRTLARLNLIFKLYTICKGYFIVFIINITLFCFISCLSRQRRWGQNIYPRQCIYSLYWPPGGIREFVFLFLTVAICSSWKSWIYVNIENSNFVIKKFDVFFGGGGDQKDRLMMSEAAGEERNHRVSSDDCTKKSNWA